MTDTADEERSAIARMRGGDIGGLESLVRGHQAAAVRAAYLVTRDRALAEEVVQEAFLRAYERIDQFDVTRPFAPWFLRSVVNAAVRAAARTSRSASLASPGIAAVISGDPGPELSALAGESREAVWAALGRLSPGQRGVVVLRYFLGLSLDASAERLGVPTGTVKRRLHDARRRLRALLMPTTAEESP
jgi:RNA polymerase sigma-70 factor (ECF subfamily)